VSLVSAGDHPLQAEQPSADTPACKCLNERDRHLFCPGPKRILALDGGGVRGAITVAFLEQIEKVLEGRLGKPVHLADWFDLVGGTSTGAVIAGAVALGYGTEDIRKFYLELAPKIFKHSLWRLPSLRPKFDAQALRKEIERVVGHRKLGSADLNTGFCLVSKRLDTGSPWILANNSRAPFWKTRSGKDGYVGNKHYPLANLVRASTAAPFYFDPEWLEIVKGEKPGLFVDGGVTPHNNPSVMLFLMAMLDSFKIRWKATPKDLTIVSIGTGSHRARVVPEELGMGWMLRMTYHALMSLMNDIQTFALMQMQYLGETPTPWFIDSAVGALKSEQPVNGKMFRFLRYDVRLELPWLEQELGEEIEATLGRRLTEVDVIRMRSMDDPTIVQDIYKLAKIAARKQVKAEHWLGDLPCWCGGRRPSANRRTMLPREPERPSAAYVVWYTMARAVSYLRSRLVRATNPLQK